MEQIWYMVICLSLLSILARDSDNELSMLSIEIYLNETIVYGQPTTIVMTMSEYPETSTLIRIYTERYLIAYFVVGSYAIAMPPEFMRTNSVQKELNRLNLQTDRQIPYERGYYAEMPAVFWDFNDQEVILMGSIPVKPSVEKVVIKTKLKLKIPEDAQCVPLLRLLYCQNPNVPLKILISRSNTLRAVFNWKCSNESDNQLSWKVYNLAETVLYRSYENENVMFTMKRFHLNFPPSFEMWRSLFVIRVEGKQDETFFAARCYVQVIYNNVEAVISGDYMRNIMVSRWNQMDGSRSLDHSKSRQVQQFSRHSWDCRPIDDFSATICRPNMTTRASFYIPPYSLNLARTYEFKLSVQSDDNPYLKDFTTQRVTIVNFEELYVVINCVWNCVEWLYNPTTKVLVSAECRNCREDKAVFEWFVDGQKMYKSPELAVHVNTPRTSAKLMVIATTKDGRSGWNRKTLTKAVQPSGGTCEINPTTGVESTTRFNICCKDFDTKRPPLEYFIYANRVMVDKCHSCDCYTYLPMYIKSVKVLICDNSRRCSQKFIKVEITPLPKVVAKPDELFEYIHQENRNVSQLASRGLTTQYLSLLNALGTRIDTLQCGEVLIDSFPLFYPEGTTTLGKLANLTETLGFALSPISQDELGFLTKVLTKLNENFDIVFQDQLELDLIDEPFINTTVACVTVYQMMDQLCKQFPNPPQTVYDQYHNAYKKDNITQALIDEITDKINSFVDAEVKDRSLIWLNAMWQTERLFKYLDLARRLGLKGEDKNLMSEGAALEIQCFDIDPKTTYEITTRDGLYVVYFSPALLKEMKHPKSNHICLKVVSGARELNWWYPEEKQPSKVLLSVRIYHDEDNFVREIPLRRSSISYKVKFGKYKPATSVGVETTMNNSRKSQRSSDDFLSEKPVEDHYDDNDNHNYDSLSEFGRGAATQDDSGSIEEDEYAISDSGKYLNCLERGSLDFIQRVRLYRINLEGRAMFNIRFKEATHDLQVFLHIGQPQKSWYRAFSKSKCLVPAQSTNTTMLLRNNCMKSKRAYLAIKYYDPSEYHGLDWNTPVPDGPAQYSFVLQERSCDYWKYSLPEEKQRWSHGLCTPVLEFQKTGHLHCKCKVLGTYTSYVFHVRTNRVPLSFEPVEIQWTIIVFYVVAFVLIVLYLSILLVWFSKRPVKTVACIMAGEEDLEADRDFHDLLIFLKTGGRINAQTTATIRLIFQTTQRTEFQFTLMQDPENPLLTRNSTYVMWVKSREIRIPTRIAVSHNNDGRFPSWYLRSIELVDIQSQLSQVFVVRSWVKQKWLVLSSSMVLKAGDYRIVESWRQRFYSALERNWINWGLWHPLTCKWREKRVYDGLSRAQRGCVFFSKMVIAYTICSCYLGHSSRDSADADKRISIDPKDLWYMFVICVIVTNSIHFIFIVLILRSSD